MYSMSVVVRLSSGFEGLARGWTRNQRPLQGASTHPRTHRTASPPILPIPMYPSLVVLHATPHRPCVASRAKLACQRRGGKKSERHKSRENVATFLGGNKRGKSSEHRKTL